MGKIPWNKGKKGLQVSWNKTPPEVEKRIISLYNKGLSSRKVALDVGLSYSAICRILKRCNIPLRKSYVRTKEHRDLARETLKKNLDKFSTEERKQITHRAAKKRGEQLKLDIEHQSKAGKRGGLKTRQIQKLRPEILKPFIEAGKRNNSKLLKWKTENRDILTEISRRTAKRTHQKYPGLASRMGLNSIESQRKNKKFYWKDVPFDSKEEMEVAKLLMNQPIKGINVHIKIGWSLEVDFFPEEKVFIEYHPNLWDPKLKRKLTRKEYMARRIKTVQKNYKNKRIEFIFDSLKNDKEKVLSKIKEIKEKYDLKEIVI